ncbi:MAG: hypothetical protein JRF30_01080 [Deltaproteobacteria bacterium]|nr:hypothetical protein [Deltaproteobacteria bacterium]MBW1793784.1 hypothetical protein [Deltaproteobacteria bacterium]MBW2329545.1 hypothetical protein [Deltaproteobacteria bacterium]
MLSIFDWIRRSKSGGELLATLEYFQDRSPDLFPEHKAIGPPVSLVNRPCKRCWVYPCQDNRGLGYCRTCLAIIARAESLGGQSRQAVVVWGHVNCLPKQLKSKTGFYSNHILGSYVHDAQHFLLVMDRFELKPWIQELLVYHGTDLKGLLQVFPTTGQTQRGSMEDVIGRAIHQDARFPMDLLRIRFFPNAYELFAPHVREWRGQLTFEVREFLKLLEMAFIFRSLLRPEEQRMLRNLVNISNESKEQFTWGRVTGHLTQEARDMLNAWKFRQWSQNQIILLYELIDYVEYTP